MRRLSPPQTRRRDWWATSGGSLGSRDLPGSTPSLSHPSPPLAARSTFAPQGAKWPGLCSSTDNPTVRLEGVRLPWASGYTPRFFAVPIGFRTMTMHLPHNA